MTASRNTAFGSITQRPADAFPVPKLQPLDPAPLATTGPGAQGGPWQTPAAATVPEDGKQTAYISFADKPDGTPPAVLDSGQAVDFIFNATGRRPIISNGRLVVENQAGAGSGSLADYYQADLGTPAHRMGMEWVQPAGADDGNGVTVYAAWAGVFEGGGTNVPRSWVHMVIQPGTGTTGTAQFWVCNGLGNLFSVKSQTFRNPAADGATPWRCESILDVAAGIAYSILPDGSLMTVTNAEIAAACALIPITAFTFADVADTNVIMVEHFANTGASAAKYGQFTSMYGDAAAAMPVRRLSRVLSPVDDTRTLAALRDTVAPLAVAQVHAPTTTLTVATTTSAANVDATGGRVTVAAGPTGRILFHISGYYEWTATDTLFWRMALGAGGSTTLRAADKGVNGKAALVHTVIEATGLNPRQVYNCTLQHSSVSAGSATLRAGGSGGSMMPPLSVLAIPA